MHTFKTSPVEFLRSLCRNRQLLWALVKRDVLARYRGSSMGLLWSFINPLVLLGLYTFVFGVVFRSRWGAEDSSTGEFALLLFSGLIVFNLFSEAVGRAPSSVVNNPNYVTKVIFPLELLPSVALGASVFHAVMSMLVWCCAYIVLRGTPPVTILLAPLTLIPLFLVILGASWFLSSLGVYLRDISQIVGLLITMNLFLSSVFYPLSALPEGVRNVVSVSPLTTAVEQFRKVVFLG
jgi:lipopolysaccharide transport system permease protein